MLGLSRVLVESLKNERLLFVLWVKWGYILIYTESSSVGWGS